MEDIIIEETNYRAFIFALANFFLLAASIAITVYGTMQHKSDYRRWGITAIILLSIAFLAAVIRATRIKKLITITMDGIIDHSSRGGMGFIPFEDIKEFKVVDINNREAIAVIPKNMDNFISGLSMIKKGQAKKHVYLDLPPVVIFVNTAKDMEPEDILTLLQKRLLDCHSLYE